MARPTYKNASAMPTYRLEVIVSNPYTLGIDGADYGPVREELESELWRRQQLESERQMQAFEKEQKAYQKHLASSHKRKKA